MNIEDLREFCLALPHTTEDIKWGNNLCFSIAEKLYSLTGTEEEYSVSMKVDEEVFDELVARDGIKQAAYFAKRMWINVTQADALSGQEWSDLLTSAYQLVKSGLPKKLRDQLT
jgi:predicted DNA-binding protein (MmcQ/YjbR family)